MVNENYLYFNLQEQATSGAVVVQGSETLTLVAKESGFKGNEISCEISTSVDLASANTPAISVTGTAPRQKITVGVGGSSGAGAQDAASAINADATAGALVTATGSADTGIAGDKAEFFLSGGDASVCFPASSFVGMAPGSRSTLDLFFKSLNNFGGFSSESNEEIVSDVVTLTIGNDNHREVMERICELLVSARGGYKFDVIASLDPNNSLGSDGMVSSPKITTLSTTIAAKVNA